MDVAPRKSQLTGDNPLSPWCCTHMPMSGSCQGRLDMGSHVSCHAGWRSFIQSCRSYRSARLPTMGADVTDGFGIITCAYLPFMGGPSDGYGITTRHDGGPLSRLFHADYGNDLSHTGRLWALALAFHGGLAGERRA